MQCMQILRIAICSYARIELFHLHGYKFKSAILLNRFNAHKYCRKCSGVASLDLMLGTHFITDHA